MKTSNSLIIVVVGGMLAAGTLLAINTNGAALGEKQHPLRAKLLERAKQKLNLSGDQKSQIKSAVVGERQEIAALRSRLQDARADLKEAVRSPGASETSVRAAASQLSVVMADAALERLKIRNEVSPKLNQEQKGMLDKFQEKRTALRDRLREKIRSRIQDRLAR